jgi:DNA-binding NtrC family response regulator
MDSEPAAPQQIATTPSSVLIVDPDFMVRWKVADYLRERGHNIIEATGASDAMALLASGMHVDIVFFDLHSRDPSDGRLLAEWLQERHPRLSLLMASTTAIEATILAPGRTHQVIVEPYELAQLAAHIDSMLKRR